MQVFAQITKVDEAKRLVFGRAAQETVDKSGELMDYESSKPHFMKWSEDVAKDTDGKSLGNLRAMHGKVAAGKLTAIDFNDAEKAIDVCAKVVDDAEWKKVQEGVYTGFSIGGAYVGAKKVEKMDGKDVTRYTANPSELSLVDRPCIPTAKFFEIQKTDGATVQVEFVAQAPVVEDATVEGTPEQVDELCRVMKDAGLSLEQVIAKIAAREDTKPSEGESKYGDVEYADEKNKKYPLDTDEHVRAAASYFGQEKNRSKYDEADQKAIDAKIAAAKKKRGIGEDSEKAEYVLSLRKGLYTCGQLAQLLGAIEGICKTVEYEEESEGDGSEIGTRLCAWLADGGKILGDMVTEEVAEAAGGDDDAVELAARAGALNKALEKVGARNSAADKKRIQDMHDNSVQLGADCAAEKLAKAELAKVESDAALQKLVADAIEPLNKLLAEQAAELKKLSEQPAPATVKLRAVAKADDLGTNAGPVAKLEPKPIIDAHGDKHEAAGLIKMIHASGGAPVNMPAALRK